MVVLGHHSLAVWRGNAEDVFVCGDCVGKCGIVSRKKVDKNQLSDL